MAVHDWFKRPGGRAARPRWPARAVHTRRKARTRSTGASVVESRVSAMTRTPCVGRQVGRDGVVPARGKDVHERREHEEDRRRTRDPAGGVSDDRAECQAEQGDHGQVERGADHGARDARMRSSEWRRAAERIDWLAKKAISAGGSISTNVTTREHDAPCAQSTGSRFGTAAREARIIPVEYSPVITSTPRTPIASWATCDADERRVERVEVRAILRAALRSSARDHRRSQDRERRSSAATRRPATRPSSAASTASSIPSGSRVAA